MYVDGVELNRMGQNMHLAWYPIHWHLIGDADGQYIRNSAIHGTYSRCVTVHGTNDLLIENNVTYNNIGHCFFYRRMPWARQPVRAQPGYPDQVSSGRAVRRDRPRPVRSGGRQELRFGRPERKEISCSLPTTRRRLSGSPIRTIFTRTTWPRGPTRQVSGSPCRSIRRVSSQARRSARRRFGRVEPKCGSSSGNVSHSNFDSFMFDRGPQAQMAISPSVGIFHLVNPTDANGPQVESVIEDFTGYKNRNEGIWARGEMHVFKNLKLADNAIGYTHASGNFGQSAFTSRMVDSLFVGETENIGNPKTPAREMGSLRPQPAGT